MLLLCLELNKRWATHSPTQLLHNQRRDAVVGLGDGSSMMTGQHSAQQAELLRRQGAGGGRGVGGGLDRVDVEGEGGGVGGRTSATTASSTDAGLGQQGTCALFR